MHRYNLFSRLKMVVEVVYAPLSGAVLRKAASTGEHSYEEAVIALNALQTNASVIQEAKDRKHTEVCTNLEETRKYLLRTGVTMERLDTLSVIHVAGTKGKGSTCSLCESILRAHGYRTGFFSSPHLVSVTERIQLAGKPISKADFARYFWRVYNTLRLQRDHESDMPPYFKFLTVMAFNVFLSEGVDVAIIEVGIGGEHDCTNVIRKVRTVGITSLGLEHTGLLGNTIEEIAWQKSGIMKTGCDAFTVKQCPAAMAVLEDRAAEKGCTISLVPEYEDYNFFELPKLTVDTEVQKLNASLAIQLAHDWMNKDITAKNTGGKIEHHIIEPIETKNILIQDTNLDIPKITVDGLNRSFWPGRCQILDTDINRFFLDGAHTKESMEISVRWFQSHVNDSERKALIFNATGERDSEHLLSLLNDCEFDEVIFVPNVAYSSKGSSDQTNFYIPEDQQFKRCHSHKKIWLELQSRHTKTTQIIEDTKHQDVENTKGPKQNINVFKSIDEALKYLNETRKIDDHTQVLVTGSLHLVGAALVVIDKITNAGAPEI